MRALFGVVSLLVVLAIAGSLVMKNLRGVNPSVSEALPPAQSGTESAAPAGTASSVRAHSQQLPQRVARDVDKSLAQGAERNQAADK
jgi:hypothetical protein